MRTLFAAFGLVSGLVLAVGGAAAADGPMANIVGNTVRITYPNGAVAQFHAAPDGSYSIDLPDGSKGTGAWSVEGGQICTTGITPAASPKQCRDAVAHAVGDKWEDATPNGPVKYELTAGQ